MVDAEAKALKEAILGSDLAAIQTLLEKGASLQFVDPLGQGAIHLAAEAGNLEIAKYLVEHGIDIQATTYGGENAMHVAVSHGHLDFAKWLQRSGISIRSSTIMGQTCLHLAARNGDTAVCRWLVESDKANSKDKGSLLNTLTYVGLGPAQCAEEAGHHSLALYLKEALRLDMRSRSGGLAGTGRSMPPPMSAPSSAANFYPTTIFLRDSSQKQGYLNRCISVDAGAKIPTRRLKWKKVLCVLQDNILLFFSTETSTQTAACLPLECAELSTNPTHTHGNLHTICVYHEGNTFPREYLQSCITNDSKAANHDCEDWVFALQGCTRKATRDRVSAVVAQTAEIEERLEQLTSRAEDAEENCSEINRLIGTVEEARYAAIEEQKRLHEERRQLRAWSKAAQRPLLSSEPYHALLEETAKAEDVLRKEIRRMSGLKDDDSFLT
ncbi:hypothetical protein CYMTET_15550 [Cymbomonas tetramitiformis]|uniref:PH domain-containing protein n=1 Tax=Cymbomonas tetramitiformis TaxID=36881 RepID=A0AAE0GDZ7_9CHLO|nr:hypothetical protein CYMTET_15550 [Cymbomonas tetramitiformis]|eukprot:gene5923-7126_t